MHKVAIVTVNYNAGALLAGNLTRTLDSSKANLRIFIVDNQSTDDSRDHLARAIESQGLADRVSLILAPTNGGFASGNNLGMRAAMSSGFAPDYFYLLNPDAYPLPGAVEALIAVSRQHQDRCLLGSTLHDESLVPRCSAFRLPSALSELQRGARLGVLERLFPRAAIALPMQSSPFVCGWVTGAGFFFSQAVQQRIGFMDEGYFLYYEELDYMRHAGRRGIPVISVPEARIVHLAGSSTGIVGGQSRTRPMPIYWYQSWHRYFFKSHSAPYALLCGASWIAGRMIDRALGLVIRHRRGEDGHSIGRFFKHALLGLT